MISSMQIKSAVSRVFEMPLGVILGDSKNAEVVEARHTLLYLLVTAAGFHPNRAGRMVNRHRTLVNHVMKGVPGRLEVDGRFRIRFEAVCEELKKEVSDV